MKTILVAALLLSANPWPALGQTVHPIIAEYSGKADGRIDVTNNTMTSMVVLLEPKSFELNDRGKGTILLLDPHIHVHLSTTSLKLAPGQTGYVFYEASSEVLPAWFTVYATFTSPKHGDSLDLRIVLPHTVYLYQREPLRQPDVAVTDASYDAAMQKVLVEVHNLSRGLGRVQEVHVSGEKDSVDTASFPLLPGATRHMEISWVGKSPPSEVSLKFDRFKLTAPITTR
jgi:hypothetical protein